MNAKAWVAELVGTFTLIFVGAGAIAVAPAGGTGLVGIALAHGLAIGVMVSAVMAVSGGHLNPAVTAGLWSAGKIDLPNAIAYIVAQCLGAVAASLVLLAAIPDRIVAVDMGVPALATGVSGGSGLLIEGVLTFFLVFVVYGTVVDRRAPKVGGLFVGLTIALDILMAGPLTGGSINPARHFGPALVAGGGFLAQSWVYWIGPIVGGILAAQLYKYVLEERPQGATKSTT